MSDPERPRFDVMIVPGRPGFRISDQGLRALFRFWDLSQLLVVREVISGDEWEEIMLSPGRFAHHIFVEGDRPDHPTFDEAILRHGSATCGLPYGDLGRQTHLYIEFSGARFPVVHTDFLDRLQQILYMRPEFFAREHMPAPPRPAGQAREAIERWVHRAAVTAVDYDLELGQ